VELAAALKISGGDRFYWRLSDDDPSVLIFIPWEVVERRYSAGERLEASTRPRAVELTEPTPPGAC